VPLIPPVLDDRSYDDLVQEMLANIPAHTPEWTNPQQGDPGRTLIELFAWLADTILYRANLIPEKQRIAFLKLLGQPMQPAAAAKGIVSLSPDTSAKDPVSLLAGASIPGPATFETLDEVNLLPLTAQVYIKAPIPPDQQAAMLPLLTGLMTLYKLSSTPSGYLTTVVFENNQADVNGLDLQTATVDQCLWIALLAGKPENVDYIRQAIGGKSGQQILNVGVVPALTLPDPFADVGPRAAVLAEWRMSMNAASGQPATYNILKPIADTTQGLTQPGIVRLIVPQSSDIGAPSNKVSDDAQAGVGPKPPRIDDRDVAGRLITWVRLKAQSALRVSWAGVNATGIDQRTSYQSVVIGVSDGTAGQQFRLPQTQVDTDPTSFQLEVDMPGLGYQLWQQVDDLYVQQGPLPVYVLDPEAGTVTFGNQMQGMIVPLGRRIRVRQMRAGGGSSGNLPAGSLTTIQAQEASGKPLGKITVQQPIATTGGQDAETLTQAEQRLPSRLRHQERAVTASDYQSLAEEVPGANVARVEVLPLFKPQTRTPDVPGVVSVMVIPEKDGVQPPCPRADRPLLETVYQYLDARRPVTAEMYVIASEYVQLGITVAVEVRNGFGLAQVSQAVETALRNYLWPIPPGSINQQGWPLGRNVRSLELEVIVSQVAGVVEVNGLNLFTLLNSGAYQQVATDAGGKSELSLEKWQLPELLQVIVAAGPDGSGVSAPTDLTPPTETDDGVAVPVVPKVC
jgi:Baseplate J-like protein